MSPLKDSESSQRVSCNLARHQIVTPIDSLPSIVLRSVYSALRTEVAGYKLGDAREIKRGKAMFPAILAW